ncbi:Hypothetical protein A7982_04200 [Minicystis rosea]|nr:Hypothetical protein A7982_04200 [Minicystis rosea]
MNRETESLFRGPHQPFLEASRWIGFPSRTTAQPAAPARRCQSSGGLVKNHSSSPGAISVKKSAHFCRHRSKAAEAMKRSASRASTPSRCSSRRASLSGAVSSKRSCSHSSGIMPCTSFAQRLACWATSSLFPTEQVFGNFDNAFRLLPVCASKDDVFKLETESGDDLRLGRHDAREDPVLPDVVVRLQYPLDVRQRRETRGGKEWGEHVGDGPVVVLEPLEQIRKHGRYGGPASRYRGFGATHVVLVAGDEGVVVAHLWFIHRLLGLAAQRVGLLPRVGDATRTTRRSARPCWAALQSCSKDLDVFSNRSRNAKQSRKPRTLEDGRSQVSQQVAGIGGLRPACSSVVAFIIDRGLVLVFAARELLGDRGDLPRRQYAADQNERDGELSQHQRYGQDDQPAEDDGHDLSAEPEDETSRQGRDGGPPRPRKTTQHHGPHDEVAEEPGECLHVVVAAVRDHAGGELDRAPHDAESDMKDGDDEKDDRGAPRVGFEVAEVLAHGFQPRLQRLAQLAGNGPVARRACAASKPDRGGAGRARHAHGRHVSTRR